MGTIDGDWILGRRGRDDNRPIQGSEIGGIGHAADGGHVDLACIFRDPVNRRLGREGIGRIIGIFGIAGAAADAYPLRLNLGKEQIPGGGIAPMVAGFEEFDHREVMLGH